MLSRSRRIAVALVAIFTLNLPLSRAAAAMPSADDAIPECHKVFAEVGLIVRASGSAKGRRIGSLERGAKVRLAGENEQGSGTVHPVLAKESDGSYWVKIKSPMPGWVLFAVPNDPAYRYLVPCD